MPGFRVLLMVFLPILLSVRVIGQNRVIDSLNNLLTDEINDTTRLNLMKELGDAYLKVFPDSAYSIFTRSLNLANQTLTSGKKITKDDRKFYTQNEANMYVRIGNYHLGKMEIDSARASYQAALKIFDDLSYIKGMATCNMNIGSTFYYLGQLDKAIEFYNLAVTYYEQINDAEGVSNCNNNTAGIYLRQLDLANDSTKQNQLLEKALNSYNKNLIFLQKLNKKGLTALCYMNIGSVYMFKKNFNFAIKNYNTSLSVYREAGDQVGLAKGYLLMGNIYYSFYKPDSAIEQLKISKNLYSNLNDEIGILNCNRIIADILQNQGGYKDALEYCFNSLKIYEAKNMKEEQAVQYQQIGNIYNKLKNSQEALSNTQKAMDLFKELNDYSQLATVYNAMGNIFTDNAKEFQKSNNKIKQADSCFVQAQSYYDQSLKMAQNIDNKELISCYYTNSGIVYQAMQQYSRALKSYTKALTYNIQNQITSQFDATYSNLGAIYLEISDSLSAGNQRQLYLNKSVEYSLKGYQMSIENKHISFRIDATNNLMEAYNKLGNYKKAMKYATLYMHLKDSVFNEDKLKEINRLQLRYERDKNLREKTILEKEMAFEQEKNEKQRVIIASVTIGIGLLVFMITFILRRLQITRRQKKIIEQQNHQLTESHNEITEKNEELNQLNEEISAQRDNLELLNDEMTKQRDQISLQHKEITASIHYASRIQRAILPPLDLLSNNFNNYFVLYKPCQTVSGDFYWFRQFKNIIYIVAADCTGHGIPGGFMSMLGISLLNEVVGPRDVNQPHEVLQELRKRLKRTLHQTGQQSEQQDGMDIALCMIDLDSHTAGYAGAYNPLYQIRNNELFIYKADRMPIGVHPNDHLPFTTREIQLQPNDTLYIFSDGYSDQFGSNQSGKFTKKRFGELLLSVQNLPMSEQKATLEQTFISWKGTHAQVDDVLVIGIKI